MIPLPTGARVSLEHPPYVVYGILILLLVVQSVIFIAGIVSPGAPDAILHTFGFVPAHRNYPALLSYVFVHAGWLHLFGNILFLWIFGAGLEDRVGHAEFAVIFLTSGVCSGLIHGAAIHPLGYAMPIVGASGAIAGILGAYLVLMPLTEIRVTGCCLFWPIHTRIAAFWFLPLWFLKELVFASYTGAEAGAGVAYWAHVGGFLVGVPMGVLLRFSEKAGRQSAGSEAEAGENIAAQVLQMREGDLERLVREGNYTLARELHRRIDQEFPGVLLHSGLVLAFAELAEREGDHEEALALYRGLANSNRLEEARARAAYRMGVIYLDKMADPDRAARVFQLLVGKFPGTDAARGAEEQLEHIFRDR